MDSYSVYFETEPVAKKKVPTLRPCPLCGASVKMESNGGIAEGDSTLSRKRGRSTFVSLPYFVECPTIGCMLHGIGTGCHRQPYEAAIKWNARA